MILGITAAAIVVGAVAFTYARIKKNELAKTPRIVFDVQVRQTVSQVIRTAFVLLIARSKFMLI